MKQCGFITDSRYRGFNDNHLAFQKDDNINRPANEKTVPIVKGRLIPSLIFRICFLFKFSYRFFVVVYSVYLHTGEYAKTHTTAEQKTYDKADKFSHNVISRLFSICKALSRLLYIFSNISASPSSQ